MKRMIKASQPASSKELIFQNRDEIFQHLDRVSELLNELCQSTGGMLQKKFSKAYDLNDDLYEFIEGAIDRFYGVDSSTKVEAADDLPKGYYDEYYGQTAYEEYGDLVSEKCAGMIISKRADDGEKPGGLVYEAERLGIEDFFDLLKCLEGMCYNRKAVEISDYQYKIL